jgi:hypothetical protein
MSRRWLAACTVAIALLTAVVLAVIPSYESQSCTTSALGATVCTSSTSTLLEHEGDSVLLVLLAPAALALIGVLVPRRGVLVAIAAVLSALALLGAMSIGLFFLPTVASAWVVAGRVTRSPRTPRPHPGTAPAA